jgi:hypothetical protein
MAHSPRQEQDPVTPTSSWKAVPKSKAPDVSLESLVGTMEQGFGAAKFLQVAKGAPLVAGWAHFAQSNKITDEIIELNKDILDALLDVNHSGIWKKTQLASALEDLDRKVELGLTLTKGKGWADQAAMLIMQSFIYLRSKQKNCRTGARYPQWLNNMLGKLSKEGSMYNSPEQGAPALPLASTPQVLDSSANHMAKHAMLLAKAKGARKPKLMYKKSESPTKAMEATTATKLPPSPHPRMQPSFGMTGHRTVQL